MKTLKEIEARLSEIGAELQKEGITLEEVRALQEEIKQLNVAKEELRKAAEQAAEVRKQIATGAAPVTVITSRGEEEAHVGGADSAEYRTAWLKQMAVRDGVHLFGEMNEAEARAYTHTTANTGAVVPTEVMNRIIELVESDYPMYADAAKSYMTSGFQIPRHKAIAAGDAAATNEGAANADEQDTFDYIPLAGVEIKKHIKISRKMKWQSIQAFEDWIVAHISERIGVAKEARILSALADATYGIDAGNVMANVACDDEGIRSIFAKIKGQGAIVVYANQATIWNKLAGVDTTAGDKAFIPSPMVDPVTQGRIYGAVVKKDDNIPANVAYFGIPNKILANEFEQLFVNHAMDPTTFEDIVAGYSLFDAGLENPLSFVKATFQ